MLPILFVVFPDRYCGAEESLLGTSELVLIKAFNLPVGPSSDHQLVTERYCSSKQLKQVL